MAYMEQLQSGLKYLVDAGEAGRRSADGMLGPVNGAISEITGAASELENIPFVGPAIGAKLQRVMRSVDAAQAKVGQVVAVYGRATRAAAEVQERLGTLKEQAGKAATAINNIAGKVSPSLANIVPTSSFAVDATPAPEAVKPFPHLLIIQPRDPKVQPYYFNLDTAAFDAESLDRIPLGFPGAPDAPTGAAGRGHGRGKTYAQRHDLPGLQGWPQAARHVAHHRRQAAAADSDHGLWRGDRDLVPEEHQRGTGRAAARRDSS